MLWRRKKFLAPVWNQIPVPWPSRPQPGPILNELSWLLRRLNSILALHTHKSLLFHPRTTYSLVIRIFGIHILPFKIPQDYLHIKTVFLIENAKN
jgi:hypothetical protein